MVDRRPISWTSLALALVLSLLALACQSTMSVKEVRQASAAMTHTPLAPPPRTITDIIAILDQQPKTDSQIALRDLADATTGQCVNPTVPTTNPVAITINANEMPTFGIFVTGTSTVSFAPALNRIFVRFTDAGGLARGSTSVAARTQ